MTQSFISKLIKKETYGHEEGSLKAKSYYIYITEYKKYKKNAIRILQGKKIESLKTRKHSQG